jgi:molecular chaperone DnaJ
MARDFYDVLGVDRNASEPDIKKAYRRLAMEHHPDRNAGDSGAEERFKEVTEAYEVLGNEEQRARYDRYGMEGLKSGPAGFGGFHHVDLSEALSMFMREFGGMGGFDAFFGGGQRARHQQQRGQDIRAKVRVTLEEVATGTTRTLKLKALDRCESCDGSGAAPGTDPVRCSTCNGAGEVQRAAQSLFGQFVSVAPCPTCGAQGTVVEHPCEECHGDGRVRKEREVKVDVPAGVSDNNYVTIRGGGVAGPRNGTPGDLLVEFEVEEDPRFERHGDDLVHVLPLSFSQVALGEVLKVPTPYGEEEIEVAAGTQSGTVLTVKSGGLPNVSSGRKGTLYVRVRVWTPKLTPEMQELFEKLSKIEGEPPKEESLGRRLWEKMKEAFGT